MWTTIRVSDLDKLERKYPELSEYNREYVLYESNDIAFLPRYFYSFYQHEDLKVYVDREFKPQEANIEFKGELRENQVKAMDYIFDRYPNHIEGIFQAYPGFGKTTVSTYIASRLGQKTLIILDSSKLLEQWVNAFTKFTNITEDDIGIIKATKMEADKPVCIAMVQTLVSKTKKDLRETYKTIMAAGFNTVFVDECHKSSAASKYAKSFLFINSKNVIGLSATPYHTDVSGLLMHSTVGRVIYKTADYELIPEVYFIKYKSGIGIEKRMSYFRDFIKQKSLYDKEICKSESYLYIIRRLVERLINAGHQTFIVCSTIAQVQLIHNMLLSLNIDSDMLYSKDSTVKEDSKVIVATYSFAGTGFDLKTLSAMIYASPYRGKKSTIQTAGRILRRSEGKDKAIIFDLIDESTPTLFNTMIKAKKNILSAEFKGCNFHEIDFKN